MLVHLQSRRRFDILILTSMPILKDIAAIAKGMSVTFREMFRPTIVENYPNLKANENFRQLQFELEGTENRILQSRRRYNEAVQKYNTDLSLPRT